MYAESTVIVLGVTWNTKTDMLTLPLTKLYEEIRNTNTTKLTKRAALSLSSKLFDPLGFIEPVNVKAKIMMQEAWKGNTNWDENIEDSVKHKLCKWLCELQHMIQLAIPRQYIQESIDNIQLHIFCDSSHLAKLTNRNKNQTSRKTQKIEKRSPQRQIETYHYKLPWSSHTGT